MKLGMIGLGRMGAHMAQRLTRGGHHCVAFDLNSAHREAVASQGVAVTASLEELVQKLEAPRAVWVMLPAGEATSETIRRLGEILRPGDTIIDGGNSFYKDDIARAQSLRSKGIFYVDVGVSGGLWGLDRGYCLMIGGDENAVRDLDAIFRTLAPGPGEIPPTPTRKESGALTADQGFLYCGSAGSGHFVKMIHNGIEYGMMQAMAEGFDILRGSQHYNLPLAEIAEVWRRGSVVSSWLLDLISISLHEDEKLTQFEGNVQDSGEGRWTLQAAIEEGVPAEVISCALYVRFRSQGNGLFGEKLLSAMRNQFGGHREPKLKKAS